MLQIALVIGTLVSIVAGLCKRIAAPVRCTGIKPSSRAGLLCTNNGFALAPLRAVGAHGAVQVAQTFDANTFACVANAAGTLLA